MPPGVPAVYSDLGFIQLGRCSSGRRACRSSDAFAELVAGPLGLTPRSLATDADRERGRDRARRSRPRVRASFTTRTATTAAASRARRRVRDARRRRDIRGRDRRYRGGHAARPILAPTSSTASSPTRRSPGSSWRLGWDTPSPTPGVSQAGDRWPRTGAVGHTGFTGTSLWLDLAHRRWVVLLTNRVHPTRHGNTRRGDQGATPRGQRRRHRCARATGDPATHARLRCRHVATRIRG